MEKYLTARNIRRAIAAVTVLLLSLVVAVPLAHAEYIENVANVNTSLAGVTAAQADNLFIHLMNRMYPVGSVFMTTDIASDGDMTAVFGGTWEPWGQGKVPVGVGGSLPAGIMDGPANAGVTMAGSTGSVALPGLTSGGVSLVASTGSVGWTGSVAWTGSYEAKYDKELLVDEMPEHNHDVTLVTKGDSTRKGSSGTQYEVGDYGSGGTAYGHDFDPDVDDLATWDSGKKTFIHVKPTGGGVAFPLNTTFSLSGTDLNPTINVRTGSFGTTSISGSQQDVSSYTLTASGSGTVAVTDNTVQPYVTCYMYKRLTLASLNP